MPDSRDARTAMALRLERFLSWRRVEAAFVVVLLLVSLGLRMYRVTAPPWDFQSWRDTFTLMVARNCHEGSLNILLPRTDFRIVTDNAVHGTLIGSELMVVPWLTALLYFVLGTGYWVGRVVPIAFSLVAVGLYYLLSRRFFGRAVAALAALVFIFSPYFIYCGRCQMPETFAFAMSFGALLFFDRWLEDGRTRDYWAAAAFALLMLLGKPHLGVTAVPMGFLAFRRFGWRVFRDWRMYGFALVVGVSFACYVWWSFIHLAGRPGVHDDVEVYFSLSKWLLDPAYYQRILGSVFWQAITPVVCVLALVGACIPPGDSRRWFGHAWLAGAVAFFFLLPGGAETNGYYQLILAPPMCLLAGRALHGMLSRRWTWPVAAAAVVALAAHGVFTAYRMFTPMYVPEYRCGAWVRENTPEDALVLTSDPSTVMLYFADRTGWTSWHGAAGHGPVFDHERINAAGQAGATVLAIPQPWFDDPYRAGFEHVRDDLFNTYRSHQGDGFTVFLLTEPADLRLPDSRRLAFGQRQTRKHLRGPWTVAVADPAGMPCALLGPGGAGAVHFRAGRPVSAVTLSVAGRAPGQTVTFRVNGADVASASLTVPGTRRNVRLEGFPLSAGGDYTVTLVSDRLDESGAALWLYGLQAE